MLRVLSLCQVFVNLRPIGGLNLLPDAASHLTLLDPFKVFPHHASPTNFPPHPYKDNHPPQPSTQDQSNLFLKSPMDIFSKLFSSLFLFQPLLALLFPLAAAQNSNLFREYIGAQDKGVKFTDVPINPDVEFHFILAFAIDYTTPTSPTDGIFNIFWDNVNLSASAVASIKQSNSNVKVALSLGGATVDGSDTSVTFHPTSVDTWVDNAVSSLTTIIQQYNLDGIDIDYEMFDSEPDTFAECIGRLLTTLKSNGVIEFASIAPYLEPLESYYKALWGTYSELIDYVNFQFYGYPAGMTVSEFLSSYETQRTNYDGGKVLASFISDGSGGLSPQNGFFNACETLQSKGELPGIVVWSADTTKNLSNGFRYEKKAQELLAKADMILLSSMIS